MDAPASAEGAEGGEAVSDDEERDCRWNRAIGDVIRLEGRVKMLEAMLSNMVAQGKADDAALAETVKIQEATILKLRREVTMACENNSKRNRLLDGLHYVWCDGGCHSGVHRYHDAPIDEELVSLVERNTKRLRGWWTNYKARLTYGEVPRWPISKRLLRKTRKSMRREAKP